ncbi:hypothetical protein JTE90_005565 [Oedothorax gibbosus]|uniref:Uncharacterized protein n=1 Tax=Oedothorax gibbosus TaxID=931172 RepID=A0AAV6VC32_9ARAC|nr:hypothetical protein JTE90_005565 [Oedothorax gibbosus]
MFKPHIRKHFCIAEELNNGKNEETTQKPKEKTTSSALPLGAYSMHSPKIGRKVMYQQNFGGFPLIRHSDLRQECQFVKHLSVIDKKKMNAKADYLRLFE